MAPLTVSGGEPGGGDPLRIGILGAARISPAAIARPAHDTGQRLVAVAARDPERARQFADEFGVERVVSDYAALVSDPEVDVVYNPLPNALHGPWNLAAIAAGKHVLSEKPFASNAAEAVLVRDAAATAGVLAVDGFHYLYHPVTVRLMEVVSSGEIGTLVSAESTMVMPSPDPADVRWSFELAGGALMDVGCYAVHVLRHLAPWTGGEPALAEARGGELDAAPGIDAWLDADLTFPSGATGSVRCGMVHESLDFSVRVVGTLGEVRAPSFVLPHLDDRVIVRTAAGERTEHLGTRPSYSYQLLALARAIRTGEAFPTDADDAVATMSLIDEMYRAAGFALRPTFAGA